MLGLHVVCIPVKCIVFLNFFMVAVYLICYGNDFIAEISCVLRIDSPES